MLSSCSVYIRDIEYIAQYACFFAYLTLSSLISTFLWFNKPAGDTPRLWSMFGTGQQHLVIAFNPDTSRSRYPVRMKIMSSVVLLLCEIVAFVMYWKITKYFSKTPYSLVYLCCCDHE